MLLITTVIQHHVMGMIEKLEEGLGVKERDYWCGVLLYADDVVLLAESPDELQKMLDMIGQQRNGSSALMQARVRPWLWGQQVEVKDGGSVGKKRRRVKAFKYLGVWFDRGMRRNVQLEKMKEKAEEWAGKTE